MFAILTRLRSISIQIVGALRPARSECQNLYRENNNFAQSTLQDPRRGEIAPTDLAKSPRSREIRLCVLPGQYLGRAILFISQWLGKVASPPSYKDWRRRYRCLPSSNFRSIKSTALVFLSSTFSASTPLPTSDSLTRQDGLSAQVHVIMSTNLY